MVGDIVETFSADSLRAARSGNRIWVTRSGDHYFGKLLALHVDFIEITVYDGVVMPSYDYLSPYDQRVLSHIEGYDSWRQSELVKRRALEDAERAKLAQIAAQAERFEKLRAHQEKRAMHIRRMQQAELKGLENAIKQRDELQRQLNASRYDNLTRPRWPSPSKQSPYAAVAGSGGLVPIIPQYTAL